MNINFNTTKNNNDYKFELLKKALDAAMLRQSTISDNIANANTKGYKAKRVVFEDELNRVMKMQNSPKLLEDKIEKLTPRIVEDTTNNLNSDGNNVNLEEEMVDLAKNQLYYNALIQQTTRNISNLRYVISEGRR